jgi:putative transposase
MAPVVRRTWSLRGQTPTLFQRARHREKVSLAAALWLSSDGEPRRLSYRSLTDGYFNNIAVAAFLDDLVRQTDRPLTVVWDGGMMHKGEPIRNLLVRHRRLRLERLPPYAPMLNPVEQLWSWLKHGRLCNFAPLNAKDLQQAIHRELHSAQRDKNRIRSLWRACRLAPERTLLF